MKPLSRPRPSRPQESTIALINVVFLMLIFFLVAGTLAPPVDRELQLIETQREDPVPPPEALSLRADGSMHFRGTPTTPEEFMAGIENPESETVRIFVDRALPARELIAAADRLKRLGAGSVAIVTLREGP